MSVDTDPTAEVLEPEILEAEIIAPEILDDDDDDLEADPLSDEGVIDEAGAFIAGTAHREGPTKAMPRFMPRPPPSRLPAKRDRSLAAADPLRAYMAEVSRYALLTPEEEHDLAVSLQDDLDQDAAYKLVTANLRLVAKIAFKYRRFYKNVLDLIQEGNIGLMKAVQKFDPYRGGATFDLRPVLDSGVHHVLPAREPPDGEGRHHAGETEALLQPHEGDEAPS